MRNLRAQILTLYREKPNIDSKEIIVRLGITPTPQFWKILNDVQVGLRGVSPDRGKNRSRINSRMKGFRRGSVRFIQPEEKG